MQNINHMAASEQIQQHIMVYDRLAKQRIRNPAEVMQMIEIANTISTIAQTLPSEAQSVRQSMLRDLGVKEIYD